MAVDVAPLTLDLVRIVAWPGAVVLITLAAMILFRKQIGDFLARVREVSRGRILAAPDKPSQEIEVSPPESGNDPRRAADELTKALDSPVLVEYENVLKVGLKEKGLEDASAETTRVLIRYLATYQIAFWFEMLYSRIWGTQINLIQQLNTVPQAGMSLDDVRSFYFDIAASIYPEAYEDYDFDSFVDFLVRAEICVVEGTHLRITIHGREFLAYLIRSGKSLTKQY